MGRISYPETSVNYPSILRNVPEKSRPHLCRGWCPRARGLPKSSFADRRPSARQQRYAYHRLKSVF